MALAVAMALRQRALVPIQQLVAAMRMMAGGNLDHPIPGADRRDEVGDISTALEEIKQAVATSSAAKAERDMAEQKQIVDAFVKALDELAQQNLEYRITQDFPPQYMGLRNNYNAAVASLAQALSGVRVGTSSLVATIAEIQSAANDLAMRNSRQAANVEETTAGMQAVVSGARETAHGSAEARIQAHSALTKAEQGGDVVTRAVEAMGAIESSSSEIRQIIAVIDGIAFQTNLLALNAGVEAARAGDAGKGFAVVANEVRALAQRSADAAKDIRGLIEISTQHVQGGVDLVKQTGTLLTDILQDVTAISHTITNIADKAGEQENTLIQVNASMLDIDQVTQQNAAMVEQTNAAAQNMASEANALSRLVSTFRTRDVATRPDVGGTQNRRTSLLSGGGNRRHGLWRPDPPGGA
jgi:methyl-accepting chemotaxis protein